MRIFQSPLTAVREVERDLWEMGIDVHPDTMQNKQVADNADYATKELQAYGFQLSSRPNGEPAEDYAHHIDRIIGYMFSDFIEQDRVRAYIIDEHASRMSGNASNPGKAWKNRPEVWNEFIQPESGKFHYTYSERFAPQLESIIIELHERPNTRQAILNIHSNICPSAGGSVDVSQDLLFMGGKGRIPCSMYYQFMRRRGRLDMVYTMRSCDFLTHFPIDLVLALKTQVELAKMLMEDVGTFTYFTGSLHAYRKDMAKRGIF